MTATDDSRCESGAALDSVMADSTNSKLVQNTGQMQSESKFARPNSPHHWSEHMRTQENSPLFRLPSELRNKLYAYTYACTNDECKWDNVHDCPKIDLFRAHQIAPSCDLMISCRRIHSESKGIFAEAQHQYWSSTTFTLSFFWDWTRVPATDRTLFPELLRNEQVRLISRVAVDIVADAETTLVFDLTPHADLGLESWTMTTAADYKAPYASMLNPITRLLPFKQHCQARYRPLLTIRQVRQRVRRVRWHSQSRLESYDIKNGRRCIACNSDAPSGESSDRRADLMAVVAWLCEMFTIRS